VMAMLNQKCIPPILYYCECIRVVYFGLKSPLQYLFIMDENVMAMLNQKCIPPILLLWMY
jgi:hypothetical protein